MVRNKKRQTFYLILLLLIFELVWFILINVKPYSEVRRFQNDINKTYSNIEQKGEKFVFVKDSLVYWSVNTIDITKYVEDNSNIAFLPNGIYLKKHLKKEDSLFVYLYLIKNNFVNQNLYTQNKYNTPFSLGKNVNISKEKTSHPITINGHTAFYLDNCTYKELIAEWQIFVSDVLVVMSVFYILLFLIRQIKIKRRKSFVIISILLPSYIVSGLLVYYLSSFCPQFSFYIYTQQIHYANVLCFIILVTQGYLLFCFTSQIAEPSKNKKFILSKKILLLLFISIVYGSVMEMFFYKNIRTKIEAKTKEISQKRSPDAEERFVSKIEELESDKTFGKLVKQRQYLKAEEYATNLYFQELEDKYHIGILVFDNKDSMYVQPIGYYTNILTYAEERIKGARQIDSTFVWVEDNEIDNNNTYIYLRKSDSVNIFVECLKKKNSKNMNYTLLLSEKEDEIEGSLSYARYHKNNLVYSIGQRIFDSKLQTDNIKNYTDSASLWRDENGYMSYYLVDKDNIYVVCFFYRLPYNILGAVSLFFLIFIMIFGLEFFRGYSPHFKTFTPGIRSSILFSLIGSFIVGITIAGFFSIRSINNFNSKYNTENIRNKTNAIRIEIENFFGSGKILDNNKSLGIELDNLLLKLSNSFLTDINLYDTNMCLMSTSQKSIFEQGFLLDKMNIETKKSMQEVLSTMYLVEQIGTLKFISAYSPITDQTGRTICYLNIPFINQQKNMDDNIGTIINNFINMFLFWVNISIIIFILLSDMITKPLQMLQEKLNKLDIEGNNDKIIWEKNDEVGDLIKTYNSMIEKLEESSYLLKQQERNSSWRELASQVAHDINNPLTPMKLSIQYLQKVLDEKPELFASKFQKLAPSLISQIDSISNIASELNNYSKPTPNKKEKTDIVVCIQNAIDLFENVNDVKIDFQHPAQAIYVMGDKNLFTRIFNNIIKNSYQAIKEKEDGKIKINISTSSQSCIISIADNGCGIKDEDKDKIFNPHFTTKQDGNGIGLTIVKTIIETYDGEINFFSKENEGTTFNITFDCISQADIGF